MNILFDDIETTNCKINGIPFHKCLLIGKIPYFKAKHSFNTLSNNLSIDEDFKEYDDEVILQFKRALYEQPINWKPYNAKTLTDCWKLGEFLMFPFVKTRDINIAYYHLTENEIAQLFQLTGIFPNIDPKKITQVLKTIGYEKYNNFIFALKYEFCNEKNKKLAAQLYEEDWKLNKNLYSYHRMVICCDGIKSADERFKLYKLGWEEHKSSNCLNMLALCYLDGIGCKKDNSLAFMLFKLNWTEYGNLFSLANLAYCYLYGYGCEKDEFNSFELYKQVFEESNRTICSRRLIECYEKGIGCEQNKQLAAELRNKYTVIAK